MVREILAEGSCNRIAAISHDGAIFCALEMASGWRGLQGQPLKIMLWPAGADGGNSSAAPASTLNPEGTTPRHRKAAHCSYVPPHTTTGGAGGTAILAEAKGRAH